MSKDKPTRRAVIRARVPAPLLEAVEDYAARCGSNQSEAVRALLYTALESFGNWPPPRSCQ